MKVTLHRASLWVFLLIILLLGFKHPSTPVAAQPDLTTLVERIGNPFTARFPSGEWVYARNVWDMEVYADRLYLGHGNSTSEPPAGNAGPVEIWSFNGNTYMSEFLVHEEQLERFEILDRRLFIPGHDSIYPQPGVNFYEKLDTGWQETNTVLEGAHMYDLARYGGRLFAATGTGQQNGDAIRVSGDGGSTWAGIPLIAASTVGGIMHSEVAWELFEVGGMLLVSAQPAIRLYQLDDGTIQRTATGPMLYRFINGVFEGLGIDPFPGHTFDIYQARSFRVVRPVAVGGEVVYIGARVNQQLWTPFGLFTIRGEAGAFSASPLPLPNPALLPWDTWIDGNTLYVLGNICAGGFYTPCVVSVLATCDRMTWRTVLQFTTETFARSFALYRGDFYFGMGSQPDSLAPTTGEILRVRRDLIVPGC